jgi:hypothetical protein
MAQETSKVRSTDREPVAAPARFQVVNRKLGIRADGGDPGISFTSVDDALDNARRLIGRGYKSAEVFDRLMGQVLRRLTR